MSSPPPEPAMPTSPIPAPAVMAASYPAPKTEPATPSPFTSAAPSLTSPTPSAMAPPSTPMTALQKRRAAKTLAQASSPSPSPSKPVMDCSASPAAFSNVEIHTAKCSICDNRLKNKEIMKRCPGCTWQICEKCAKTKEDLGRDFSHGNPITPGSRNKVERKKLFAGFGAPGATLSPGADAVTTKSNGSGLKMEIDSTSSSPSPAVVAQIKGKLPTAMPPAVTPTKRSRAKPASKSKTPKGKGKGKKKEIDSDDNDLDEDEDFTAGASASKRQKTQQPAPLTDSPLGLPGERRSTRVIPSKPTIKLPASLPGAELANNTRLDQQAPHPNITIKPNPMVNQLPAKKPNRSMESIRDTHPSLDFLERYKNKFPPDTFNPTGPMQFDKAFPTNHKPDQGGRRRTAEEIQALIQEKVRYKLWGPNGIAGKGPNAPGPGNQRGVEEVAMKKVQEETDNMPTDGLNSEGTCMTARQYVDAGYEKLVRDIVLDSDQQNTLRQSMAEAARKYATKFYNEHVVSVQGYIGKGLDLKLNVLPETRLSEFKKVVADEAYRLLKEFAEENDNNGASLARDPSLSRAEEMLTRSESIGVDHQFLHGDSGALVHGGPSDAQSLECVGPEDGPPGA